jgi:hypothetical protein
MSEIKFFDAFCDRPYNIIVKDSDGKYSYCLSTADKEIAINEATIYLKTYKYVKVVYKPTGEIVWEAGDKPYNIFTLSKGKVIQLNNNYVLEELGMALVSNYPDMLSVNNVIIGNGKSTCKELIKEKAKGDLIDIENQLRELTEAVNKLKEILGE